LHRARPASGRARNGGGWAAVGISAGVALARVPASCCRTRGHHRLRPVRASPARDRTAGRVDEETGGSAGARQPGCVGRFRGDSSFGPNTAGGRRPACVDEMNRTRRTFLWLVTVACFAQPLFAQTPTNPSVPAAAQTLQTNNSPPPP